MEKFCGQSSWQVGALEMQNSVLEDGDGDRATGRGPAQRRSSSFSLGDKACEHERFIEGQWI